MKDKTAFISTLVAAMLIFYSGFAFATSVQTARYERVCQNSIANIIMGK